MKSVASAMDAKDSLQNEGNAKIKKKKKQLGRLLHG